MTAYGYDALRRLQSVTRAGQTNATLGYDAQDNVVSVTDARDHTTTSIFDDLGNERSVVSPDSGTTTSTYDAAGNLTSQTNAKGETVNVTWDALNRPTRVSWPNALRDTVLVWDETRAGALSRVQEEEFERAFTYNALGQVTGESFAKDGVSVSVGYGYDEATGDLVSMTYPSGNVIRFTRDANGQVSAIQAGGVSLATEIVRLPFGPIKSEKLRGGALALTRSFDQRYQLGRIQAGAWDVQYTRDAAGQVTSVTGIAEPTLTEGSEVYSVNPANNQMTTRGNINYTYDAAGNLASDGTRTFIWDALGRLKQVQQGEQVIATYGYDIQNRRFRKTVGSTTTYYLYNLDNQIIAEISGTGTVLREYVWLDGEPFLLAEYTGINVGMYFYLNDHLGTPQQLLNGETGTVAWQAAYLPFGEAQVQVGTVTNNLRFPGQYYDVETRLHYNWNRYYDPKSGRYISTDPIGFIEEINLYVYSNNNSIDNIDISGLQVTVRFTMKKGSKEGIVTVIDLDSQETATFAAFSGNKNTLSLPFGVYDILEHEQRRGFYRLEPQDIPYGDDTHNETGRTYFRMHHPGGSLGCITAHDPEKWKIAENLINKTKTTDVKVNSKRRWINYIFKMERLKKYGTLTVEQEK